MLTERRGVHYTLSKRQFREWLLRMGGRMTCIDMRLEHFYGSGDDTTKFVSGLVGDLLDKR